MQKYDVIIIGSGLGGLVCGSILSKEGYKVCVVEQHWQIGGCLQNFKRNNSIFVTGVHYIGSMDEGQILYRYFNYLGIAEKLKLKRMDPEGFDIISFDGEDKQYRIPMAEEFDRILLKDFPKEKEALKRFKAVIKEINDSLSLVNLDTTSKYNFLESKYFSIGVYDFLKSITSNTKLQNVLAGNNPLYAGDSKRTPLYIYAVVMDFFINSAWRLIDGGAQIADLLSETITNNGGTVLTKYNATKFIFENNKIKCLKFSNEKLLEAKYFISSIHPAKTLELVEKERFRTAYRNRILSLENSISSFALYITFKKNSFPYINSNIFHHNSSNVWELINYSDSSWPKGYLFYTQANSNNQKYADSAIVLAYMKYEEVKEWGNSTIGKRDRDYINFKTAKSEKLLCSVEKQFPGIRESIDKHYSSSPLTLRDYLSTVEGTMYGVVRDFRDPLRSFISSKTKIPNLFLTGQNTNIHGVLGVTVGSFLTCSQLIPIDDLRKRVQSA